MPAPDRPERREAPEELVALGLRAIRAAGWRWWDSDHALPVWICNIKTERWMHQPRLHDITPLWFDKLLEQDRIIPDLSSPCVVGWVEHLVCEAHGDDHLSAVWALGGWDIGFSTPAGWCSVLPDEYPSKTEALVEALEVNDG